MSVDPVEQTGCAKQPTGNRRLANNAPEARLQTRQLHARVPAWKLQLCVQAFILFASEGLVSVSLVLHC